MSKKPLKKIDLNKPANTHDSRPIVTLLEKMPHTQVMLTSHNTNLISNRIKRSDCYFILTENKLTSLVNSID